MIVEFDQSIISCFKFLDRVNEERSFFCQGSKLFFLGYPVRQPEIISQIQKGIKAVQSCSVGNQKGAIAIDSVQQ